MSAWTDISDNVSINDIVGELPINDITITHKTEAIQLPAHFVLRKGTMEYQIEGVENHEDSDSSIVLCEHYDEFPTAVKQFKEATKYEKTMHLCTVNVHDRAIFGTLAIPKETLPGWLTSDSFQIDETAEVNPNNHKSPRQYITSFFSLEKNKLVLETQDEQFVILFRVFQENQMFPSNDCAELFYNFLQFVISDDVLILDAWQDRMNSFEVVASGNVNDIPKDFDIHLTQTRAHLYNLTRFYKQLMELARTIASTPSECITSKNASQFRLLVTRCMQLIGESQEVSEHAMQVRLLQQNKIGAHQSSVVQMLTIVATVCMSVSLITGWYGMNFDNMPELHNTFAYALVIILAIVVVVAEMIYFKRKKWF